MATRILSKAEAKEWDRFVKQTRKTEYEVKKVVERITSRPMQGGEKPRGYKAAWWSKLSTD